MQIQLIFVHLATEAAKNAIAGIPKMEDSLEQDREPNAPPTHLLDDFVGRYINTGHEFIVEIRKKDGSTLQVAFQGLDSQVWDLRHYQHNTFIWLSCRDHIVKRARFPYAGKEVYTLIFQSGADGAVVGLLWPHEPGLPIEEQYFHKLGGARAPESEAQQPLRAV